MFSEIQQQDNSDFAEGGKGGATFRDVFRKNEKKWGKLQVGGGGVGWSNQIPLSHVFLACLNADKFK